MSEVLDFIPPINICNKQELEQLLEKDKIIEQQEQEQDYYRDLYQEDQEQDKTKKNNTKIKSKL